MEEFPESPRPTEPPTEAGPERPAKEVSRRQLANKINFLNFRNATLLFHFKDPRFGSTLTLTAKPQPCAGEEVECLWENSEEAGRVLPSYQVACVLVPDGRNMLLVHPENLVLTPQTASFRLPEAAREVRSRRTNRFPCQGIRVQLFQNGAVFTGILRDLSAEAFRVDLSLAPPQTFDWLNPQEPIGASFQAGEEILYSGECRMVRHTVDHSAPTVVLEPLRQQSRRFHGKRFRSLRVKLVPAPDVSFRHPFTGRPVDLKVVDLSGSGFAVEEELENSALFPGMVIPRAELNFAQGLRIGCRAQVIYRNPDAGSRADRVRCGLAILDMTMEDQVRLLSLLQQARDGHSYLCNAVDRDDLWRFFFETGFIYPEKYLHIQARKDHFQQVYDRLYTQNPKIARHFVYQENGRILGHIAMLRHYNNAWLIHHHAADKLASRRAGLAVLTQISQYVNELHRLRSAHLNYVFCYFRPDNRFPEKVFGGTARHIADPKGCWVEPFAYCHFSPGGVEPDSFPEPWRLVEADAEDLRLLQAMFEHRSSTLLLQAFDLLPSSFQLDQVATDYQICGFRKERLLFSLKKGHQLLAVFLLNLSDPGLNLSELANCIHVISLDENSLLNRQIIEKTLRILAARFDQDQVPVLFYPSSSADHWSLPAEKMYNLWILDLNYLDKYFEFCHKLYPDFTHSI